MEEFLGHLWLTSPPLAIEIALSESSCRLMPGCRSGAEWREAPQQPSLLISCRSMQFSNSDSFPSVHHFAHPPRFGDDDDGIYNGFSLQAQGLTVSLHTATRSEVHGLFLRQD